MDIAGTSTCVSCGRSLGTNDRFCGKCGTPVAVPGPADQSRSAPMPKPELLLAPSDDEPPRPQFDPIAMVLSIVAVALIGLSAWGLLRSSRVVMSGIGDGLIGVLVVDPTEPEPTAIGTDGVAINALETFEVRRIGSDGQLMVERETGTSLLAASALAWTLIDLDTGDRHRVDPQGVPVLVSDGHLVVERDQALWSIPLTELGRDSTGMQVFSLGIDGRDEGPVFLAALSGLDEMLIVSLGVDDVRQVARLDLASGDHAEAAATPPFPFVIDADRRRPLFVPVDLDTQVRATFGPTGFDIVDGARNRVLAFDGLVPEDSRAIVTGVQPTSPFTARRGLVAVGTGSGLELLDLEDDVRYRVEPDFFVPRPRRFFLVPS